MTSRPAPLMGADPDGLPGIEVATRLVTLARLVVIAVAVGVILIGQPAGGRPAAAAWLVAGVGLAYSAAAPRRMSWELRGGRPAKALQVADAGLGLCFIATTGGIMSPAVALLFVVVVGAVVHFELRQAMVFNTVVAASLFLVGMSTGGENLSLQDRAELSLWWSGCVVLTGLVGSGLLVVVARQWRELLAQRASAHAEREAAAQERDLRERLLTAYQAQQDGLSIILHEFRTPVASTQALAKRVLAATGGRQDGVDEQAARLLASHAEHLADMLDGLAEVARTEGSPIGVVRHRHVELEPLLLAAADAGGLRAPQLHLTVVPAGASEVVDVGRLRRIVTNLAENAVKHGGEAKVEVDLQVAPGGLVLTVADHGPGVPPDQLHDLTVKGHSRSQATTGLGLWIVEQLVHAMGGSLAFADRDGGGLQVTATIPRWAGAGR